MRLTDLSLSAATAGFDLGQAAGAFIVCAALIVLFGVTGWVERVQGRIAMPIASAPLAGVGSAFWGVVAGGLALFVQQWRPRQPA